MHNFVNHINVRYIYCICCWIIKDDDDDDHDNAALIQAHNLHTKISSSKKARENASKSEVNKLDIAFPSSFIHIYSFLFLRTENFLIQLWSVCCCWEQADRIFINFPCDFRLLLTRILLKLNKIFAKITKFALEWQQLIISANSFGKHENTNF